MKAQRNRKATISTFGTINIEEGNRNDPGKIGPQPAWPWREWGDDANRERRRLDSESAARAPAALKVVELGHGQGCGCSGGWGG